MAFVGDPDEVREMYERHAGDLFSYLVRRVGRQPAEDLLAETFKAAIESSSTFDPALGSKRAWLFGIATNLVRRHWKCEQRRLMSLQHVGQQWAVGGATRSSIFKTVSLRVSMRRRSIKAAVGGV